MERTKAQRLFLIALFLFTIAGGLSASIISNYFKGVFAVDAVQRGLLEIPRELPGVVCVLVIAALPTLGSLSLSLLGFGLYFVGLFVLGLLSPSYAVMQLFVFTYSMGQTICLCPSGTSSPWFIRGGQNRHIPRHVPQCDDRGLHGGLCAGVCGLPGGLFLFPPGQHCAHVLPCYGDFGGSHRLSVPPESRHARAGRPQAGGGPPWPAGKTALRTLLLRHSGIRLPEADAGGVRSVDHH